MADEVVKKRKKRRTTKKKTVVDSAARNAASLSDGCNPELVKGLNLMEYLKFLL